MNTMLRESAEARAAPNPLSCCWMIRNHMPAVLRIEQLSFDRPWVEKEFLQCLREQNTIGLVHETHPFVDGFILYGLEQGHIDILNMAVDPHCRRQGVGAAMIAKLKSKLGFHRRRFLRAQVYESNLPTLLFLRRMGFLATQLERKACPWTGDDGITLEFHL